MSAIIFKSLQTVLCINVIRSWNFVHRIDTSEIQKNYGVHCEEKCRKDKQCSAFKVLSRDDNSSSFDCYLLSSQFLKIRDIIPNVFPNISGYKLIPTLKDEKTYVVRGPLVTDSSSEVLSLQHFAKGCAYTVSLWLWLVMFYLIYLFKYDLSGNRKKIDLLVKIITSLAPCH